VADATSAGAIDYRAYGWRARLGLIVPTTNTVNEAEWARMAPDGVTIHSARTRFHAAADPIRLEDDRYCIPRAMHLLRLATGRAQLIGEVSTRLAVDCNTVEDQIARFEQLWSNVRRNQKARIERLRGVRDPYLAHNLTPLEELPTYGDIFTLFAATRPIAEGSGASQARTWSASTE
jgi:hypothetical protein